jgi:hypothetical protein
MARKTASNAKRPQTASAPSARGISADASLAQAQKTAPYFKKLLTDMHEHMQEAASSRREADYRGHHVVIETTYKVTVDGKPFDVGLGVTDSGRVYYHGMPNVGFESAVDLIKAVIDTFADEFAGADSGEGHEHHDHEDGGHDHSEMVARPRKTKKANTAMKTKKHRR